MHLVPREIDKLIISQVGFLAQRRLARGLRLNIVEATGLIASVLQELIRDGKHSVAELMAAGKQLLGRRHVLPSVVGALQELQVEGTFPDGTYLVTIHYPICTEDGDLEKALYGSFLPVPSNDLFPLHDQQVWKAEAQPGAVIAVKGTIELNKGRKRKALKVTNKGDRPIQVGSHYNFVESNPYLEFDRVQACGFRLNIIAGTAVRFEPGETKSVTLVEIGGGKRIYGGNRIVNGCIDMDKIYSDFGAVGGVCGGVCRGVEGVEGVKFAHVAALVQKEMPHPLTIDREAYAATFGPTEGDLVKLGDTDLWIKVEKDYTFYGDECKFGGGKTLREGSGQICGFTLYEKKKEEEKKALHEGMELKCGDFALDLLITNALIVDYTGIYKADIGVKNGVIVGVGKGGNPDVMDGVTPGLVMGANTDVIAGEGKIVTYGGFDSHIHFICPQQAPEALASGITSILGGGTGPSTGTNATTCTPGANYIREMMQACEQLPLNVGITGRGNDSYPDTLREQVEAGVVGLKLHEDWGTTPAVIDTCLDVCDEQDVQCLIHTDTLNESGFVEQTIAAFKGRTIHTYHTEGAGGGHAPDIISVVEHPNVLPSSTNPTRPFTKNTVDEHLDMLMVCHHLSKKIPEDVAFAESRIREETIAAEDVLHDLGAISMMSSDSQAMGRVGEVVLRTWKTAHKNKIQRGPLPEDEGTGADNFRVKRYISKYTINPAIAHGVGHLIGSIEKGKLADLVVWDTKRFGTKPDLVLKGGMIAWAMMGDPNGSIGTVQPIIGRPMFAALVPSTSFMFVSQKAYELGVAEKYGLKKRVAPVVGCRNIGKKDMKFNDSMPKMRVDPESYVVEADGVLCKAPAVDKLPLTQEYFLY